MENSKYSKLLEENKKIFIISKEDCSLCEQLKLLFETIEVEFDIYKYEETEDEINNGHPFKTVMKHHTGGKMFPFCYINGEYVGGYQQVYQNLMTGKLKEQLNEINIDFEEDF